LVALLAAAADGAKAQSIEAGAAPAVPQASEPSLSLREARLVGAAAGLALGAVLGRRAETPVPALRPLRGADAIVTGSAAALYLGAGLLGRKRSEAASAAHGAGPMREINGFDRKMRKLAVGHRSLEKRLLLDDLTGMAAGGLAGWLIPKLHKPDRTASPSAVAPPAPPAVVAAVPVVLRGGRSAALVTVGSIGGGPYVGVHWQW
jgi:hypothetical protein